jgi:hypothetical protein
MTSIAKKPVTSKHGKALFFSIALSALICSRSLLVTASKNNQASDGNGANYAFNPVTVVMCTELTKFIIAFLLYCGEGDGGTGRNVVQRIRHEMDTRTATLYVVPAVLCRYCVLLLFHCGDHSRVLYHCSGSFETRACANLVDLQTPCSQPCLRLFRRLRRRSLSVRQTPHRHHRHSQSCCLQNSFTDAIQNNLVFVALVYLSSPTFELFANLKIVTTAIAYRIFMVRKCRRPFSCCALYAGM